MTMQTVIPDIPEKLPVCAPRDFLDEAVDSMVHGGLSAVIVMENAKKLVGILTDDDVIRAVQSCSGAGDTIAREQVLEWMSVDPITVDVDTSLEQALALVTRHQIHHLIVMRDDKPVALIGISDILTALHDREDAIMSELKNKILIPITEPSADLYLKEMKL